MAEPTIARVVLIVFGHNLSGRRCEAYITLYEEDELKGGSSLWHTQGSQANTYLYLQSWAI